MCFLACYLSLSVNLQERAYPKIPQTVSAESPGTAQQPLPARESAERKNLLRAGRASRPARVQGRPAGARHRRSRGPAAATPRRGRSRSPQRPGQDGAGRDRTGAAGAQRPGLRGCRVTGAPSGAVGGLSVHTLENLSPFHFIVFITDKQKAFRLI